MHLEFKKELYVKGSKTFLKYRDEYIFQFWKDKDIELFLQHIIKQTMYFLENNGYSGELVFQDKFQIDVPISIDRDNIYYYYFKLCTGISNLKVNSNYSSLHRYLQIAPNEIIQRVHNTYIQGIDILKREEYNMIPQEFYNLYYCYIGILINMEYHI